MRELGRARKESARNKHRNKFASKSDTYWYFRYSVRRSIHVRIYTIHGNRNWYNFNIKKIGNYYVQLFVIYFFLSIMNNENIRPIKYMFGEFTALSFNYFCMKHIQIIIEISEYNITKSKTIFNIR